MVRLRATIAHVWRRPRAWVVFYLLVTLPATLVGLSQAAVWSPLLRSPVFTQALETRRLDFILDFLTCSLSEEALCLAVPQTGESLLIWLFSICGLLLIWPLLGLLWVALEGAALASYAAPKPLTWPEFWRKARFWFGPFLLLNSLGLLLAGLGLATLLAIGYWVSGTYPTLGGYIRTLGWAWAGGIGTWVELMRAAAVSSGTRHLGAAAQQAWRTLQRHPSPLAGLVGGGLLLYGLLAFFYQQVIKRLPFSWWLAVLVVQQAYFILRLGVRLAREAGMVACAQTLDA